MGNDSDDPRPGFTHWERFKGQGVYYNPVLNIDGKQVAYKDYCETLLGVDESGNGGNGLLSGLLEVIRSVRFAKQNIPYERKIHRCLAIERFRIYIYVINVGEGFTGV